MTKNIEVKIPADDSALALANNSLAPDEIKKLDSCIDLLVGLTNSLNAELSSTNNKQHYIRCAKAIQGNAEAIRKLTLSIYDMRRKERRAAEKDVTPGDWESL